MEDLSATGEQRLVLTWTTVPSICVVAAVVSAIGALVVLQSPAEAIALAALTLFFAAGAWAGFARRYELANDELVVRHATGRRTIRLSELLAAAAVPMKASQGRVFWHLVLRDREGQVRLSFLHTTPDARTSFLTALAPYVMASGVERSGPIDRALLGLLW